MKRLILAMIAFGGVGFAAARATHAAPVAPQPGTTEFVAICPGDGVCSTVAGCQQVHGRFGPPCFAGVCCTF